MPMILELLRHGEAFAFAKRGDSDRALTPRGEQAALALATALAASGWAPDRVFSSPYRRARSTAQLLLQQAGVDTPVDLLDELTPDRDPEEVLMRLEAEGLASGRILLVAHMPLLGRLAGYLTGDDTGLSTCELVRIECPPDGAAARTCKILSRM